MFRSVSLISCVAVVLLQSAGLPHTPGMKVRSSEIEKGYATGDIQKGWAFGQDKDLNQTTVVPPEQSEGQRKCDALCLLQQLVELSKLQLEEQRQIKKLLEKQIDPKPHVIKREDGSECIANASPDCFEFPLTAEAKKVPVLAAFLTNPHDQKSAADWKAWQETYLSHTFDIGQAIAYETERNPQSKLDYRRSNFDTGSGAFGSQKAALHHRLIEGMAKKGLWLKVYLGLSPQFDLIALDTLSTICEKHTQLKIEVVFAKQDSYTILKGAIDSIPGFREIFSKPNITKRMIKDGEIPNGHVSTPIYEAHFRKDGTDLSQIVITGKVSKERLDTAMISWLEFEKIINAGQLYDGIVWRESSGAGADFWKNTYNIDINTKGGK